MTEAILDRDLLKSWKLWCKTEFEKEKEWTFKKEATREIYKKKYIEVNSDADFKYCLSKVRNRFIKKCEARRQKTYMRIGLLNPKYLSANVMSSRLKILNNYLVSFPSPDNKSFSEGEII